MKSRGILRFAAASAAGIAPTALLAAPPVHVRADQADTMHFNIPAGSLNAALITFARQSGLQLIYAPQAVQGHRVPPLRGSLPSLSALQQLIARTDLTIRPISKKVIILKQGGSPFSAAYQPPPLAPHDHGGSMALVASKSAFAAHRRRDLIDDIVVTGTNIRGKQPVGSSVRTLTHADMERNGYSTVAEALQALPGNFGGAATEQSALSMTDQSGTNATLSTGVNLRGLGAEATLVLINGHRIAGSGTHGDFADVSNIPMSIVERVEVLKDGASAIYGSDAVGGVVNIVTNDHYQGVGAGARTGSVTTGHGREFKAHLNAGTTWHGGSLLLSYEFYRQTPLHASDRRATRSADLRPLGGSDHRYPYSLPGNILGFNPKTGGIIPAYAIPEGQDGTKLTAGDFVGVPNLQNYQLGVWVTADQRRHSLFASLHQDLTSNVHAALDVRFSHRKFESRVAGYATVLAVTPANPWFVSPDAQPYELIGYSFAGELGATHTHGWSEALSVTGSLDVDLSPGWQLSNYVAFARSREFSRTDHLANNAILAEALGTIPYAAGNAYDPAEQGYFNPYGNGRSNAFSILAAIGSGYQQSHLASDVLTANSQVDGPLFDLPGGRIRVALGTNVRRETFSKREANFFSGDTPTVIAPVNYGRTIVAGYGELRIPLFAAPNARQGLHRLELSAAVRVEHYPSFGVTANPKIGVDWEPTGGLTLRGTFGTSFRAPNLLELHSRARVSTVILPDALGQSHVAIACTGGNPSLQPERARSWTLGADLKPAAIPGLHVGGTLFRTIFERRIDRPVVEDLNNALVNNDLAPFVRPVSPATNSRDRADVAALLGETPSGPAYPASAVSAIVDGRYVNTGRIDVRGFDTSIGYRAIVGPNTFDLNADATYLFAWRRQTTPNADVRDLRNEAGRPVDFRGRLTAGWTRGNVDTLVGFNFVNAYHGPFGQHIGSWTTIDAGVTWHSRAKSGPLSKVTLAISVRNLLDCDPPFYDSNAGIGYDAANSDVMGRFVALQLTKHW